MKIVFLFIVVTLIDVLIVTDIISMVRALKNVKEGDVDA